MIRFWCECGRQLQATEKFIGQAAVCPLCERTTLVPATDQPRLGARVGAGAGAGGYSARERDRYDFTPEATPVRPADPTSDAEPRSGLATAAMVCGLLSFPFMLSVLAGLPAVVLGALALFDRRVREGELAGKGKAIAGMMLGVVGTVMLFPAVLLYNRLSEDSYSLDGSRIEIKKDKVGKQSKPSLVKMSQNVELEVADGQRRVLVTAEVCKREGPLEQLMTRKGAKEHEAILAANVDARKIHQALLLAEAKPGSVVRFLPDYRPPTGTNIRVSLRYVQDGKTKTVPARSWIRNVKTGAELGCDWVFAGSQEIEDAFNKGQIRYLANEGDVICIANFEGAMLDVPIESSKGNEDHGYEAWTERIPAEGTKVTVILEPLLK